MKNLISEYGDVMANIGAKDVSKYDVFKKYNKNKKQKKLLMKIRKINHLMKKWILKKKNKIKKKMKKYP